jgi:hypothetical protein
MEHYKKVMVRKWIDLADKYDKDAVLLKLLEYSIDNNIVQIDSEDEDPYWMTGYCESLI